ncbi:MAG: outer membrane beta-barrel protein, partial [Prevotella sp.]
SNKSIGHNLVFADAVLQARINSLATIELEYNMHNRLYTSNSQIGTIHLLNASIKHEFLNGRLTASAGIDNILNQQNRYRMILDTYTTNTHINMAESGRVVKLTVAWNINRGKKVKEDIIEKSASAERKRLEESKKSYK